MKRLAPLAFVLFLACAGVAQDPPAAEVRNVVLLIGDGMGVSQVTLARLIHGKPLAMDEFPVTGLAITVSADHPVTDSAAAATALASGTKTGNFAVGVDPDGKPLETVLEQARRLGKATGLVTTSKITHATPASFAAHVSHRSKEGDVARQYLDAGVDVLLGGGRKFFDKELVGKFADKRYAVIETKDSLGAASDRVLGLFDEDHVPYVLDRGPDVPSLADMTRAALRILSGKERGFFLMIEGARIDMACHANDAASSVHETIDFDEAIRAALDFARQDGRTLVLLTADHATGGLAITEKVRERGRNFAKVKASAERMDKLIKQSPQATAPEQIARAVLKEQAGVEDATADELKDYFAAKGPYDPAALLGEIVSKRLGVTFVPMEYRLTKPNETHGHDGAMVSVYAFGPGAGRFAGTMDNTDIPKRIRQLAGYR